MQTSVNVPYVKRYKNGELANPIKGSYSSNGPNRKARRAHLNKPRLFSNSSGTQLRVFHGRPPQRYTVRKQFIGNKVIVHYDEA